MIWAPLALYLTSVVLNPDGTIKRGYVINGDWDFEVDNGECLAKDGHRIVNRWAAPKVIDMIEIPSDSSVGDDYDSAIEWAENQRSKETDVRSKEVNNQTSS